MSNLKVALICDEKESYHLLSKYYEGEGINVEMFHDYMDIIKDTYNHNIILIDEELKSTNVYQMCELLKQKLGTPMIMLSNKEGYIHEKQAFDSGCVDYVKQPYNLDVLIRRMRVQISNSLGISGNNEVSIDNDIVLDRHNYSILVKGIEVDLTMKQYEIIHYLVTNTNRVVTRKELIDEIWGKDLINVRIIDTHIKNIRKILPQLAIETVSGGGYRYRRK